MPMNVMRRNDEAMKNKYRNPQAQTSLLLQHDNRTNQGSERPQSGFEEISLTYRTEK